jgi:hypothetical protein
LARAATPNQKDAAIRAASYAIVPGYPYGAGAGERVGGVLVYQGLSPSAAARQPQGGLYHQLPAASPSIPVAEAAKVIMIDACYYITPESLEAQKKNSQTFCRRS